jgi:uncharacterized membrane protein
VTTPSPPPPAGGAVAATSPEPERGGTARAESEATGHGTDRLLGAVLLGGGLVGAVAAVILLLEKVALLADPGYVPSCSIDPVLSCGSVMRTAQAAAFGFPNPVLGVASFPVVAVAGALVLTGTPLPRWFWLGLQFGATAGLAFVGWLIVQSLVVIGALCPYCMVVWVVTIAVAWFVTARNLDAGDLDFGRPGRRLARRRGLVLALVYLAVVIAVVASFPAYWAATVGL